MTDGSFTQTILRFSRDDANPFESIDEKRVGELVRIAAKRGRDFLGLTGGSGIDGEAARAALRPPP